MRGTELLLLYATDRTTYIFLHPAPPHSNPTHRSLPHSLWDFMDVLIKATKKDLKFRSSSFISILRDESEFRSLFQFTNFFYPKQNMLSEEDRDRRNSSVVRVLLCKWGWEGRVRTVESVWVRVCWYGCIVLMPVPMYLSIILK